MDSYGGRNSRERERVKMWGIVPVFSVTKKGDI